MQKGFTAFGSQYKKAKGMSDVGRGQSLIKDGKQQTEDMLKQWEPRAVLDISSVHGGKQFMDGLWHFGFLPHLDLSYCGLTPNKRRCFVF